MIEIAQLSLGIFEIIEERWLHARMRLKGLTNDPHGHRIRLSKMPFDLLHSGIDALAIAWQ
jgi:hypothetical protein